MLNNENSVIMKKLISFIFLFAISILIVSAQTDKKNIIKFFPISPFFGKATFGYERVINEKSSVTFNMGLPTGVQMENFLSSNMSDGFDASSGSIKGLLIMPGYRINLSKKNAPLGFYFEPYLKYEKFEMDILGEFIDDDDDRFPGGLNGNYSGFGLGFQFGAQWLISDVVSIDFTIIGTEGKIGTMELLYTDNSGGVDIDDVYIELEDALNNVPIIGDKIELTKDVNNGLIVAKLPKQFIPGIRFAFSIGIAF